MARRVIVQISCDLCRTEVSADSALEFAIGGRSYRVDLCPAHQGEFTAALQPYVDVAEPTGVRRSRPDEPAPARSRLARRDPEQLGAIRTWARANGFQVSDRGRIPHEVEVAYNARSKRS